jgi:4-alpha-glucanotransferase
MIRTAYSSVANTVIIPLQDILGLGSEARMNFPGKLGGNWTWRFDWKDIDADLANRYKELCEMFDRPPKEEETGESPTPNDYFPEEE